MGRELAEVALARVRQGGRLTLRQREQLRRVLARIGDELGWAATAARSDDPLALLSEDVASIAALGTQALAAAVAAELAAKPSEMAKLRDTAASARALAAEAGGPGPSTITYAHTGRVVGQGLVTMTETITVTDAADAESCAETIEGNLERWARMRDQMVIDLERKQEDLAALTGALPDFVRWTRGLLAEVITTLQ